MSSSAASGALAQKALAWLKDDALPLWTTRGFDEKAGVFQEALSAAGEPVPVPRRAMVQARQIYSARIGAKLGCLPLETAREQASRAASALMRRWSLPSGAFIKSVDPSGKPADTVTDLYTQAFAIFGLAQAQRLSPDPVYERRAAAVLDYLRRERRLEGGGYSELEDSVPVRRSNPHMHLYEAALAWLEAGGGSPWSELAAEMAELCASRFIDPGTGALAERFGADGRPERGPDGFFFEPGHHFEWAWLLAVHGRFTVLELDRPAAALYRKAQACGLGSDGFVYDEVWSSGVPKTRSSRFWPQAERCKAAARLGAQAAPAERAEYAASADQALESLLAFLDRPAPGLWSDQRAADGTFLGGPSRASALYHIIAAIDEHVSFVRF